jgi:hypothetical protein
MRDFLRGWVIKDEMQHATQCKGGELKDRSGEPERGE